MIPIIPGCRCHFFAFWPDHNSLTRIILFQHSDWAVSHRLYCFAAFVKLCFDCRRTHALSFSLYFCFLLFHQIATAWANVPVTALPWDRRWLHCECEEKERRKEIASRLPRHQKKKRHFFHFLPGLQGKKYQEGGKDCRGRGWGEIAGHSAKKWICLVWEPAWRGWAEAWKVSQRKFSTNWNKTKKNYKKRIKLKIRKKKRLNAQVGDEVYFVIRKGESSLRYTQRLSSSDIKLQFLFCLFMF